MDPRDERALHQMIESLKDQVALKSVIMQSAAAGHPQPLMSVVFTLAKAVVLLNAQVGLLDARIQALEDKRS